jgi:RNA polymerase sigma-70 factor (ECF subfamily)
MTINKLETPSDLEQVFLELNENLYQFVYLRCGHNRETAEDMTQQVFYKAWKKRGTFNSRKSSLKNWIYIIARNEIIDFYRSKRISEPLTDEIEATTSYASDADQQILLANILNSMEKLVPTEKELIILHYIQQLDARDISRIVGATYIATKVRIHRALNHLRQVMEVQHEKEY